VRQQRCPIETVIGKNDQGKKEHGKKKNFSRYLLIDFQKKKLPINIKSLILTRGNTTNLPTKTLISQIASTHSHKFFVLIPIQNIL